MRPAVLTIRRDDLVAANACAEWLAWFDDVCAMRGDDRAPLVRRGGVTRRDPTRLRIELTPLAQVWLSLPLSPESGTAWRWLRERGVVGSVSAQGADLSGANLRGADLRGANLTYADLRSADLSGANLTGALCWHDASPHHGWVVRDGMLTREVSA